MFDRRNSTNNDVEVYCKMRPKIITVEMKRITNQDMKVVYMGRAFSRLPEQAKGWRVSCAHACSKSHNQTIPCPYPGFPTWGSSHRPANSLREFTKITPPVFRQCVVPIIRVDPEKMPDVTLLEMMLCPTLMESVGKAPIEAGPRILTLDDTKLRPFLKRWFYGWSFSSNKYSKKSYRNLRD